jgi:hypothetical protein
MAACLVFAVTSLKVRLEVAAPPAPPAPEYWAAPPAPPFAVWLSVSVPPVVLPLTTLVSVLDAPAPPDAPPLPLPPAPPTWVAVAEAE